MGYQFQTSVNCIFAQGVPTSNAADGTEYVDTTAMTFYKRIAGAWVLLGNGAGGPITLTGDVAAGPGVGILNVTINLQAVSYGKIQNVGASRLTGNPSGAPASMTEIPLGSGLAFAGGILNCSITQYTDQNARDAIAAMIQNGTGISWAYVGGVTLTPTITLAPFSTTNLSEGVNKYFTDFRADDAVGAAITDTATIHAAYAAHAFAWSVKANSVDVTLMHATATAKLFGRFSAGAGAGEELGLGQGVSFVGGNLISQMTLLAQYDYAANNTWTANPNTKLVFVQLIGGGASGFSGSAGTSAAVRIGGYGGSAGEVIEQWFLIGDITSPQSITVGAQQNTVGTSVTGTNASVTGATGNPSSFGSLLVAEGGSLPSLTGPSGAANPPGSMSVIGKRYLGVVIPGSAPYNTASAVAITGFKGGKPSIGGGPGGGAQGAGLTLTTQVTSAGLLGGAGHNANGKGLFQNTTLNAGEGGGTVGPKDSATAAIAPPDIGANLPWFGDGAASAGSSKTTNAGDGAKGAAPGGGGSGGGACDNLHNSGNGGPGARGGVRIWEFG